MLNYGRHLIDDDDIRSVIDVMKSDFLTTGPIVARFEAVLAESLSVAEVVVVSSGTSALHVAALALDLQPGDVCIVPSISFVATANAIRYCGGEVVFSDVDPETGIMRPEDLRAALAAAEGRRVRAVLPVHLAGQVADIQALEEIARAHDLIIVEDASHALGTMVVAPDGSEIPVGTCGHGGMATFSMHPVKTIAMGEGGAIATSDSSVAARLRRLRSHGLTREPDAFVEMGQAFSDDGELNPWYYELSELGFNYRASDIHCALGESQLKKLPAYVAKRARLREVYVEALAALAPVVRPEPVMVECRPAWHLMVALIDFAAVGQSRAAFMRALAERGIGTQVHYIPIHRQPYYRERYGEMMLPGADAYYQSCVSLPLHPSMAEDDIHRVVSAVGEVLNISR